MNTVHIPTRGRSRTIATAVNNLVAMQCDVHLWVETQELDLYQHALINTPITFHRLTWTNSPSSTGARNEAIQWARRQGQDRIWIVDDNVVAFGTFDGQRKVRTQSIKFLPSMEDFARNERIDIIGPERNGFVRAGYTQVPLRMQHRQYSVINLDTTGYFRTRWNEDTDLCLRTILSGGRTCTLNTHTFTKSGRSRSTKHQGLIGGNSAIYDNAREDYANEITLAYPEYSVKRWKWGRWHAVIRWSKLPNQQPAPTSPFPWTPQAYRR